jgi:hypothetical protein
VLAVVLAVGVAAGTASADAPPPVTVDGPADVRGLRIADLDGDGVKDLLLLGGREVRGWRGRQGAVFPPSPTWRWTLPEAATFVSPGRPLGEGHARTPTLLALAGSQALRLAPGKPPAVEEGLPVDVGWTDPRRGHVTDFVRGTALFLPTPTGYRWIPDWVGARGTGHDVPLPPRRRVTPAGPFLEDRTTVSFAWPAPFAVAAWAGAGGRPAAFFAGSDGVHAFVPEGAGLLDLLYPTSFLPPTTGTQERRTLLVDLDADGVPDFVQETTTNNSGEYAFFRTPPPRRDPAAPAAAGPVVAGDLRPARGLVRLTGFQLPADYVDLDGDGRTDFVVTTIEIDGGNVTKAVMKKVVTARTRAFLNRSRGGAGDELFAAKPDVERGSEIGVRVRFTYSGSIEVQRSYTILAGADLDGDRRKDLVIRTGPDALTVWPSTADGVWEGTPRTIAVPAVGASPDVEGHVGDLTGDGRDDLVLVYRAPPGGADRTVVVGSP